VAFDAKVVAAHAAAIRDGAWFARVGLPFSPGERAAVAGMAPRVKRIGTWAEVRRSADDPRANAAYDRDADEVVALKSRALAHTAPDELLAVMSAVVDRGLEVFHEAAVREARRAGVADEELTRVAAGAAAEAVYRGALAEAVAGPSHPFVATARLFAGGRWPLARIEETLVVF
jgi:hypothetical protein